MPITEDIMNHDILGPAIREGMDRGKELGEQTVVLRQIEKRFGSVPAWAHRRVQAMSVTEIEETALRLLDAASLEELLGR
jgi:hypothetical protein